MRQGGRFGNPLTTPRGGLASRTGRSAPPPAGSPL